MSGCQVLRKGLLCTCRTGAAAGKVTVSCLSLHNLQKLLARISQSFPPHSPAVTSFSPETANKGVSYKNGLDDEARVPAGNELGDSCHACQQMGVKSEKQLLCVEIPTEIIALAQDFF